MIIDVRRVYTWFDAHYRMRKSTQGWYTFDCPYCDGVHKMAVHFKYGIVKCWKCEARMRVMDFISDIEGLNFYQTRVMLYSMKQSDFVVDVDRSLKRRVGSLNLPKGFNYILDGDTVLARRARTYLEGRGFDLNLLDSMGVGYCTDDSDDKDSYFGYIILPFVRGGELVYYIARDYIGNFLRYRNPPKDSVGIGKSELLFNEDALLVEDRVFVVEGVFDALTLGKEGTATLGWSMSSYQKSAYIKSPCKEIVFVPDKDFYKQAVQTAMSFIDYKKVYVVCTDNILPDRPKMKDVNDLGRARILDELGRTEQLTFESAMKILM